ncbi:MAG: potassium channel family protein [Candidatus Eiseniibacteriota bacterium]
MSVALPGIPGLALIAIILWDAVETVLVPRRIGRRVRLTRYFYIVSWQACRVIASRIRKPSRRETLLGFFGPSSLLLLLVCWAIGLVVGFALLQIAARALAGLAPERWVTQLYMSGETFFTLGFGDVTPATGLGRLLSVVESGMGFGFLGTVVGYLPTIYSAFSQREIEISLLDAWAGSPPSAAEFLARQRDLGEHGMAERVLSGWERWAAQLLETHISYPLLAYYRSQHSNQSWLAALTVILDSTAVLIAAGDTRVARQAERTFAMARHAMVDITQIFVRRYQPNEHDRLPEVQLARLRARLVARHVALELGAGFEERLKRLRLQYEPYALAIAAFLIFDLPPWVHSDERRDNWQGGPWDRQIAAEAAAEESADDHF